MQHVVIHPGYGGFDLTPEGAILYGDLTGIELYPYVIGRVGCPPKPYDPARNWGELIHYSTKELAEGDNIDDSYFAVRDIERDDPALIEVVRTTEQPELKIVEIPDDVDWVIEDYDGAEWVAERHRTWH